jgi:hypothetical protein
MRRPQFRGINARNRTRSARSDRYRQVGLWQGFQNGLDWLVGMSHARFPLLIFATGSSSSQCELDE